MTHITSIFDSFKKWTNGVTWVIVSFTTIFTFVHTLINFFNQHAYGIKSLIQNPWLFFFILGWSWILTFWLTSTRNKNKRLINEKSQLENEIKILKQKSLLKKIHCESVDWNYQGTALCPNDGYVLNIQENVLIDRYIADYMQRKENIVEEYQDELRCTKLGCSFQKIFQEPNRYALVRKKVIEEI